MNIKLDEKLAADKAAPAVRRKTRLDRFLDEDPALAGTYFKIRKHAPKIVISGYDITKRCNLRCEGCFFFEGDLSSVYPDNHTMEEYEEFFSKESSRGVTYPHFAGAEPALVQDRLRLANKFWKNGLIYTNGTLKIDPDITFMLHVSLWGNEETDKVYRGAPVFKRGIKNYAGEDRAIFMYTINHQNIDYIMDLVRMCRDNGNRISFNHYSPSRQYNEKLRSADATEHHDSRSTFRFSTADNNLRLTPDDLRRVRDTLDRAIEDYRETVIYSHYYNAWINDPKGRYEVNAKTGWATNCTILNKPYHRQYHTDFSYSDAECCVANIDCYSCRHYVAGYTMIMDKFYQHLDNKESFANWLDVYDTWCRLHFRDWDKLD